MPTPTETWQDRRGMFQRGKDVHQPGRKLSNQFGDPLAGRRTSIGSTGSGVGLEKTDSIEEPGAQRRRVSYAYHRWWCCVALETSTRSKETRGFVVVVISLLLQSCDPSYRHPQHRQFT
jgi:hypothetical protein